MTEVIDQVPARCRACPYFSDDTITVTNLQALRDSIDERSTSLIDRGVQVEDIELYITQLETEIELAKQRIIDKLGKVAGCPGVDFSDFVGIGKPVRFGRCQSPLT